MRANASSVFAATAPRVSFDSIVLDHGHRTPRAFVLFHGLTASPKQFAAFGAMLHADGANVSIPRLPRHGHADRLTTELEGLTANELRDFADASIEAARALGDELVVVGFSVGGLLGAWIAQHRAVARVVCVAPFLGVVWLPSPLTARAASATLRVPNRFLWWDPVRRERFGLAHGYPRFPTHAVAHAARFASALLADARRVARATHDVRIVVNASESTVNNAAARTLARRWERRDPGVRVHRLRGLPASHDIIEPGGSRGLAARVYPELFALVAR